jgi:hypothetical protein
MLSSAAKVFVSLFEREARGGRKSFLERFIEGGD